MRRVSLVLVCGLMGILLVGVARARQNDEKPELSAEKLVNALRLLNTQEYSYKRKNGRFAAREEMLTFLREKGFSDRSPIDLENPEPYELALTTSPDGSHYQIALRPSENCKTAAFSDDRGLIFLGVAIGCEAALK